MSAIKSLWAGIETDPSPTLKQAEVEQNGLIEPNPMDTIIETIDVTAKVKNPYEALEDIAENVRLREDPDSAEGVTHTGQEGAETTRYGIVLNNYPKVENESDIEQFARVYKQDFQPTVKKLTSKYSKLKEKDMGPLVWNIGTNSPLVEGLLQYNIEKDTKKLFGKVNGTVGTANNSRWSPGLVNARVEDWNMMAEKYVPEKVVKSVKYYKSGDRTMRTYTMADGTTRTLYVTKPLAKGSKNPVGTTIEY